MKNLSIMFLAVFASIIVSSCQPPKPGGSDSPGTSFGGQVEQPTIRKPDSSIEKSIEGRNLKDSVLEGKK